MFTFAPPAHHVFRVIAAVSLFAGAAAVIPDDQSTPEQSKPEQLLPLDPSSKPFEVMNGDDEGKRLTMSITQDEQTSANWTLTLEDHYRMHLTRSDDGAVICRRLDIIDEGKAAEYNPPITLIPARVRAAQSTTSTGSATIVSLDSGETTNSGSYTHTLQDVSRVSIDVPAGKVEGYLLEMRHVIDLDLATLTINLEMATSDTEGEGLVYLRVKRNLEKIGLFGDTTIRSFGCAEFADSH